VNDLTWRKSSYSGGQGGNCVEVAATRAVFVRDTTDRAGVTLAVPAFAWSAFLAAIRES
jgi:cobalamin biosynthesis protein CobT